MANGKPAGDTTGREKILEDDVESRKVPKKPLPPTLETLFRFTFVCREDIGRNGPELAFPNGIHSAATTTNKLIAVSRQWRAAPDTVECGLKLIEEHGKTFVNDRTVARVASDYS